MNVLSLFSGIGGLDLAAHWAGMKTVAFCEIDDYACKVLERRFPGVPIYRDVRELTADRLGADGIENIDLITGGFPCQDVSCAGKRVGFHDSHGNVTRSGLWSEYARIIGEVKPKWIVVENVRGLLSVTDVRGRTGGRIWNRSRRFGQYGVSFWMVLLSGCRRRFAARAVQGVCCGARHRRQRGITEGLMQEIVAVHFTYQHKCFGQLHMAIAIQVPENMGTAGKIFRRRSHCGQRQAYRTAAANPKEV